MHKNIKKRTKSIFIIFFIYFLLCACASNEDASVSFSEKLFSSESTHDNNSMNDESAKFSDDSLETYSHDYSDNVSAEADLPSSDINSSLDISDVTSSYVSGTTSDTDHSEISDDTSDMDFSNASDISEDIFSSENDPALNPQITIDSAGERFSDKFTNGEIITTDTLYKSEFVNVSLSEINYGGKLYFVQDIYIKNIECLSVGFAGGSYGAKYNDYVYEMTKTYAGKGENVVSAINGDYCGLNGKGAIIRNGVLYGTGIAEYTVCVLYKNGVINTISKDKFDANAEIAKGAWHAWDFGPSFLEKDGSPISAFTEKLSISKSNPRTVIGYYEPGHYCFVVAGGRKKGTAYGVSFSQISNFMSNLGCKIAYNLDGGESSVMVFGEKIANEEYQGHGRRISDIVYIKDLTTE